MCSLLDKNTIKDRANVEGSFAAIRSYLSSTEVDLPDVALSVKADEEHGAFQLDAAARPGSVRKSTALGYDLFDSSEFSDLKRLWQQLSSVGEGPYFIASDSMESPLEKLDQLGDRLGEAGKKGLAIQRYKGLGEMNPEQLWETTMDPTKRTLLQVRVGDAIEADKLFSTLMGDLVEPRRDFIASNALSVRNLDT